MSDIIELIWNNLVYYQLWNDIKYEVLENKMKLISGFPPNKLSNDDKDITIEYVIPIHMQQYKESCLTLQKLEYLFNTLPSHCKRIILGIANDNGTVVYYFIYKGLHRPKKN